MARLIRFVPLEDIVHRIRTVRGQRVILDRDLAELYGVKTMVFNQAVKRKRKRFPGHFAFRLTEKERREVITNCDNPGQLKYSPVPPVVFTEHGALMAATVLNSPRAIQVSVRVIEAFVQMRQMLASQVELARKLAELERAVGENKGDIRRIFEVLKQLLSAPPKPEREIGFHSGRDHGPQDKSSWVRLSPRRNETPVSG
jgi:hypothetical protein